MDLYIPVKNGNYGANLRIDSANKLLFEKLKIKKINPMNYIKIKLK